jgi:hypothetical protein
MSTTFSQIVESQIKDLSNKTNDELLDIIGAYALSQEPDELHAALAVDGRLDIMSIRNAAGKFLKDSEPILKSAICGPDGIAHYVEQPTIKDVVGVLLPALGISTGQLVPTALIAVGLILLRAGLREYCQDDAN